MRCDKNGPTISDSFKTRIDCGNGAAIDAAPTVRNATKQTKETIQRIMCARCAQVVTVQAIGTDFGKALILLLHGDITWTTTW
jgi:hypothetical protein